MLLRISHETRFTYSEPVSETIFEVRMAPQSDEDQTVLGYRLRTSPRGPVTSFRDGFGNRVDLFNLMVVLPRAGRPWPPASCGPTAASASPGWPAPAGRRSGRLPIDALEFLLPSPLVGHSPAVDAFVAVAARAAGDARRRDPDDHGGGRLVGWPTRSEATDAPRRASRRRWRWAGASARTSPTCSSRACRAARPAGPLRQRLRPPAGRAGDPRLVPGLGRAADRLGRRRPDARRLPRGRPRRHRDRPRLLRRPPEPRPLPRQGPRRSA